MEGIGPQQRRISIESALADAPIEWLRNLSAGSPVRRLTAAEELAAYVVSRVDRAADGRATLLSQPALFHDDLAPLG